MRKLVLCHMRTTKAQISLISAFVIRCLDSIIPLLTIAEILRRQLVSSAEQAGWSRTWSKTLKTGFLMTRLICKNREGSGYGLHCFLCDKSFSHEPAHLCNLDVLYVVGVVIAGFYRASDVEMMPFYALLWGLGQTIIGIVFSFTRILATL